MQPEQVPAVGEHAFFPGRRGLNKPQRRSKQSVARPYAGAVAGGLTHGERSMLMFLFFSLKLRYTFGFLTQAVSDRPTEGVVELAAEQRQRSRRPTESGTAWNGG